MKWRCSGNYAILITFLHSYCLTAFKGAVCILIAHQSSTFNEIRFLEPFLTLNEPSLISIVPHFCTIMHISPGELLVGNILCFCSIIRLISHKEKGQE